MEVWLASRPHIIYHNFLIIPLSSSLLFLLCCLSLSLALALFLTQILAHSLTIILLIMLPYQTFSILSLPFFKPFSSLLMKFALSLPLFLLLPRVLFSLQISLSLYLTHHLFLASFPSTHFADHLLLFSVLFPATLFSLPLSSFLPAIPTYDAYVKYVNN